MLPSRVPHTLPVSELIWAILPSKKIWIWQDIKIDGKGLWRWCFPFSRYPSRTPPSLRLFHRSASRYLPTLTSSLNPFRRLVFSTKSRAVAMALAISSGLVFTSLSRGSPGTTLHRSKTRLTIAWPCVWIRTSVSNPKLSMTGTRPLTPYRGVPAIGPSERTWPLRRDSTVYSAETESAGPVMETV